MKNTPNKKNTSHHKEEELEFKPLLISQAENNFTKNHFSYFNSTNGFQIHNSLMNNKVFSPILTPKDSKKKLVGESVFKTPHSKNLPSVEKNSNDLATPDSRSHKQQKLQKTISQNTVRIGH